MNSITASGMVIEDETVREDLRVVNQLKHEQQ